jgi:hypothetical protein
MDKPPYRHLHKSLEISLWKEKKTQNDTIMTEFFNPYFSIFLCDKHNVIISKVYYESIFSL